MPSGRAPHDAGDPHDVLAAHVDGVVDDALHDAGVVAHVDEGELLAVLAAAARPSRRRVTVCADVLGAQLAAQVGAHGWLRTSMLIAAVLPGG